MTRRNLIKLKSENAFLMKISSSSFSTSECSILPSQELTAWETVHSGCNQTVNWKIRRTKHGDGKKEKGETFAEHSEGSQEIMLKNVDLMIEPFIILILLTNRPTVYLFPSPPFPLFFYFFLFCLNFLPSLAVSKWLQTMTRCPSFTQH